MQLYAKKVSAIASGDYYQVVLDSDGRDDDQVDPFEQSEPYFLLQCQFEFSAGGKCYVESTDEKYIGNFKLKLVEFTSTRLEFKIARPKLNHVEICFALTDAEFEEALPIVEVIFGIREPEYDEQIFDGSL
jgi:hypothetical protein